MRFGPEFYRGGGGGWSICYITSSVGTPVCRSKHSKAWHIYPQKSLMLWGLTNIHIVHCKIIN